MKVIIVGAGAAGLTAGHLLLDQDVEIEILEAGSTHGGRLKKTEAIADFPIDLGAEWIHRWIRARPPLLAGVLSGSDPDHPTFRYRPRTLAIAHGGRLRRRDFLRFLTFVPDDKFVDSSWFDVIDGLATPGLRARLRLDSPVTAVDHGGDGVAVTVDSGERHLADKVLVTVPIALLQRDAITFDPPLPADKRAAIATEEMPGGLKVFIEFSTCFYPDLINVGGLFGGPDGDCNYYNAALNKRSSRHVLGLFTQGEAAERYLAQGDDDAIAAYVMAELDELFDGKPSRHHIAHVVQNWSAEPYIGGSYSNRKAKAATLAAPIGDKVYFAGEAMNPNGKTIAVHGACESAYAAVEAMGFTVEGWSGAR